MCAPPSLQVRLSCNALPGVERMVQPQWTRCVCRLLVLLLLLVVVVAVVVVAVGYACVHEVVLIRAIRMRPS